MEHVWLQGHSPDKLLLCSVRSHLVPAAIWMAVLDGRLVISRSLASANRVCFFCFRIDHCGQKRLKVKLGPWGKGLLSAPRRCRREVGGKKGRDIMASWDEDLGQTGTCCGARHWRSEPGASCRPLSPGGYRVYLFQLLSPRLPLSPESLGFLLETNHIHLHSLPQSSERPSESLTRTRMATSTAETWATACAPWATCPRRWSSSSCPSRST